MKRKNQELQQKVAVLQRQIRRLKHRHLSELDEFERQLEWLCHDHSARSSAQLAAAHLAEQKSSDLEMQLEDTVEHPPNGSLGRHSTLRLITENSLSKSGPRTHNPVQSTCFSITPPSLDTQIRMSLNTPMDEDYMDIDDGSNEESDDDEE